ncbi:hypothetical protein [Ectobacillus funiculus]|uniref:DUF1656 domain-containing protein n=1 Tax=Ectobacillus funiculus TaxID=137993 RepID=A0ABV5WFQ5_9BACI
MLDILSPYSMLGFIFFGVSISFIIALHIKIYSKCSWEQFAKIISNGFGVTLLLCTLATLSHLY